MTIAGAYAGYDAQGGPVLGVFADSRETRRDGHRDDANKVLHLTARACCTASGDPVPLLETLPGVAKSLASLERTRRRRGHAPLSLWQHAGALFQKLDEYRTSHAAARPLTVIVAGYLSDRSPALAQATFASETNLRFLFKPRKGQIVCRTAGAQEARELAAEAARYSIAKRDGFEALLGVLKSVAEDNERFKGIGGSISLAVAHGGTFSSRVSNSSGANELYRKLDDENLFVPKFTGGLPRASRIEMSGLKIGVDHLFDGDEPRWTRDDSCPVPHIVSAGDAPSFVVDHMVDDGLEDRELASVQFHRGGPPIEEPPRASVTDLPTASDQLTVLQYRGPNMERMAIAISLGANGGFR